MNERSFGQPQAKPPVQEVRAEQHESQLVRIEDWAREHHHEALLKYIESSDQTNRNVGLERENMYYDPEKKTMTLTVTFRKEWHQGHEGVMQGGMPAVFIDTTSGALAFTEMPSGSGPLHKEAKEVKKIPIIDHEVPIVVTCSFEEAPEDFAGNRSKMKFIKTVVTQGPNVCVESFAMVRPTPEELIDKAVEDAKARIDTWLSTK